MLDFTNKLALSIQQVREQIAPYFFQCSKLADFQTKDFILLIDIYINIIIGYRVGHNRKANSFLSFPNLLQEMLITSIKTHLNLDACKQQLYNNREQSGD